MRIWLASLLALLVVAGTTTAGATSYIKLTPAQVLEQAELVAVGRVTGALPAQRDGEHSIVNGMVVQVETYLGKTAGPARLQLELFGGTVCNMLGQCTSIAGGMEGQQYIGQRLLIAVGTNPVRKTLVPVGAINGIVRLTESGWGVVDPKLGVEEKAEWEAYLGKAPRVAPAAAPAPAAPPATSGAQPRPDWQPPVVASLLAAAVGIWLWKRRRQA